jgi:hypothetical protein
MTIEVIFPASTSAIDGDFSIALVTSAKGVSEVLSFYTNRLGKLGNFNAEHKDRGQLYQRLLGCMLIREQSHQRDNCRFR